jgi:hypothetical protein
MTGIAGRDGSNSLLVDSNLPLWFKPEKFLDAGFSADSYVNDLKRYVCGAVGYGFSVGTTSC